MVVRIDQKPKSGSALGTPSRSSLGEEPSREVQPRLTFTETPGVDTPARLGHLKTSSHFYKESDLVLYNGDCRELLREIPDNVIQLVVTSPPYNLGKVYERRMRFDSYLRQQEEIIRESARTLSERGSLCWQVGNYIERNECVPLDVVLYPIFRSLGLRLRNRVVWHFEHGLHCSKRLSGRYESILWFTKGDDYTFNLDAIRIPQKYKGKKYYKGPKAGQLSGHPLGKNPGDVWDIPNVKHNHVEKTIHPCQFPVELVERLVLALTSPGDWVLDPFIGVGSTAIAAVRHRRKVAGADIMPDYIRIAWQRLWLTVRGKLKTRPMGRPIYSETRSPKTGPQLF